MGEWWEKVKKSFCVQEEWLKLSLGASERFWMREEQVCGWEEFRGGGLKPGSEDVKETVSGESCQLSPEHLFLSARQCPGHYCSDQ